MDLSSALTPREQEVLGWIRAGRRNAEIAADLNVSVKTIEFHVTHVLTKLNVRSRTEAILQSEDRLGS